MCRFITAIDTRLAPLKRLCECFLSPLVFLLMRLYVAWQFFVSGWLKFGYVLHNQLDTLYFLFEDTYKVPFLPTKVAAWMGMSGELGLSILLALGLFGRFGALGLIVMCGVIYNTDQNPLAPYWALICAAVAVNGAGKFSVDALLFRKKEESGMK